MSTPTDPHLDDSSFWRTLQKYASNLGRDLVVKTLALYYAMNDGDTPTWAKGVIVAALVYLISPIDAIPDAIPFAGLSDDALVLAGAAIVVAVHIKAEHWSAANAKAGEWFGK